jgi:hypothetical protein
MMLQPVFEIKKSFHLDAEMMRQFGRGGNLRQRQQEGNREGSWLPKE